MAIRLSDCWGDLTPLQQQFNIACRESDRVVLRCGRQVGKTEYLARRTVAAVLQGKQVWYLTPTHQLGKVAFRRCVALVRKLPADVRRQFKARRSAPHELMHASGGMATWLTTGNPDSLQGATLDECIIDEAATVRDLTQIIEQYVEPTLAVKRGRLVLASTPKGEGDFAKYCRLWREVHAPTTANPLIDPAWVEARRQELEAQGRGYYFRQEYLAEIVDELGVFWERLPTVGTLDAQQPYDACGIDWGVSSPYAAVYIGIVGDTLYVADELYRAGVAAEDQARMILTRKARMYVADPSTPDGVLTVWRECGLVPKLASRDRVGGWEMIRQLIAADKLVISPNCQHLLDEMTHAQHDPRRPDDLIGDDHALDALRYAVVELYTLLGLRVRTLQRHAQQESALQPDSVMVALAERARQNYIRAATRKRR